MYGDTSVIRRQADRMDERAGDLRATGRSLSAAAESTVWVSVAGDRMRERVADRRTEVEATAEAYEAAAAALRRHADEVDELKRLIEAIENRVRSLITGAVDRLRDFADSVVDGAKDLVGLGDEPSAQDERLASYAPPPPGDRAWLDVPDDLGVRV